MAAKKKTAKRAPRAATSRRYRYRCRVEIPGRPKTRETVTFNAKSDAVAVSYCQGLMLRRFPAGTKAVSLERAGYAPAAKKAAKKTARKRVARTAKKKRRNPAPRQAELRRAQRAFEAFTGHDADVIEEYLVPGDPGALWALGPVPEIHYIATRDGETVEYVHKFRRQSRPLLAASSDGSQLFLLGGAFSVTDRGIVDDP